MKSPSRIRRTSVTLSESISRQLTMYTLASGAAGVGVLALAQPVEAKIIYTATHKVIGLNGSYNLDLNHDGIADFRIFEVVDYSAVYNDNILYGQPLHANGVTGTRTGYAAALLAHSVIGANQNFSMPQGRMCQARSGSRRGSFGPWVNVTNRYLGLKFQIKGKTHYGWARLTVKSTYGHIAIHATLTGYAFETLPNKAIIAGRTTGPNETDDSVEPQDSRSRARKPAALGLLALGSPGLSIWRRPAGTKSQTK